MRKKSQLEEQNIYRNVYRGSNERKAKEKYRNLENEGVKRNNT
jgi:hypothetical protein